MRKTRDPKRYTNPLIPTAATCYWRVMAARDWQWLRVSDTSAPFASSDGLSDEISWVHLSETQDSRRRKSAWIKALRTQQPALWSAVYIFICEIPCSTANYRNSFLIRSLVVAVTETTNGTREPSKLISLSEIGEHRTGKYSSKSSLQNKIWRTFCDVNVLSKQKTRRNSVIRSKWLISARDNYTDTRNGHIRYGTMAVFMGGQKRMPSTGIWRGKGRGGGKGSSEFG